MQNQSIYARVNRTLQVIVSHKAFTAAIIAFICFNALIVGLETYPQLYARYGQWFYLFDVILLWIFTVEIAMRFLAASPKKKSFF